MGAGGLRVPWSPAGSGKVCLVGAVNMAALDESAWQSPISQDIKHRILPVIVQKGFAKQITVETREVLA